MSTRTTAAQISVGDRTISLKTILAVSANSRDELRPQDVDRVMELADSIGCREQFRMWLLSASSFIFGTREEIQSWQPETVATQPDPLAAYRAGVADGTRAKLVLPANPNK